MSAPAAERHLPCDRPHEAGFTLIEVLVAFVVSAVTLGMIFAAVQLAASRERTVAEQAAALRLARTQIEQFIAAPYAQGTREGSDGALRWSAEERAAMRDPRGLMVLAELRLDVRNARGQRLIRITRRSLKSLAGQ